MSSPSRVITATDASSSSDRAVVTGTGPDARDLAASPCLRVTSGEGGTVDGHAHLDRLARPFARQRHERVGCVGGTGLAPTGPARVAEDPIRVRLPRRAEPGAGVGRQASLDAIRAIRIGPLVRAAVHMQPARPRFVVHLGAGPHLATAIAQALHARRASGLE